MIDGFHINGSALIYVGSPTNGGALTLLGYTQDGADVELTKNTDEIMSDIFGTRTPHDIQDMGETASFNLPMIATDRAVLKQVLNVGDKPAPGQLNTAGIPLGSAGYGFLLGIASPADEPWCFYRCFLRPNARVKLGTKASPFNLSVMALPRANYATIVARGSLLYSRVFP